MKNFTCGLGEQRKRNGMKPRKPLRTITEMAVEFGVTKQTLVAYIAHHNGPRPVFVTSATFTRSRSSNTWYDPDVLREWWKDLQPKLVSRMAAAKERRRRKESPPTVTRAFLAQQWLREHGPATQRQLMEAGFINMSAATILKMIGFGALTKDKQGGRVMYSATDTDYLRRNGRSHYDKEETPNETT